MVLIDLAIPLQDPHQLPDIIHPSAVPREEGTFKRLHQGVHR
jgi:hypothetical protein